MKLLFNLNLTGESRVSQGLPRSERKMMLSKSFPEFLKASRRDHPSPCLSKMRTREVRITVIWRKHFAPLTRTLPTMQNMDPAITGAAAGARRVKPRQGSPPEPSPNYY